MNAKIKKGIVGGLLFLLIAGGILSFRLLKHHVSNVEIISTDGTTKFTLENATYEEIKSAPFALNFRIGNINTFYASLVENNPYYLYTLNEDGSRCREEGDFYLFCKDGHYFYLDMGSVYADLVESVMEINTWGLFSFEDLAEFYERTAPEHYRVDEAAKSIHVDMYEPDGGWRKEAVTLSAAENGVVLSVSPEYTD